MTALALTLRTRGRPAARRFVALGFLSMSSAAACSDPVHDQAVDALGPEQPGVPPGANHRPGQPCLTCHGGQGPASFEMSFGGTLYAYLDGATPAGGASIHLLDGAMHTFATTANCVGNFWAPESQFQATFPVQAAVQWGTANEVMRTEMRLDGSCNFCHRNPETASSPGHPWVLAPSEPKPESACP